MEYDRIRLSLSTNEGLEAQIRHWFKRTLPKSSIQQIDISTIMIGGPFDHYCIAVVTTPEGQAHLRFFIITKDLCPSKCTIDWMCHLHTMLKNREFVKKEQEKHAEQKPPSYLQQEMIPFPFNIRGSSVIMDVYLMLFVNYNYTIPFEDLQLLFESRQIYLQRYQHLHN